MSRFDKNYENGGYIMKYEKSPSLVPYNNCVMQFLIEMKDIEPTIWRRILVPSNYNFWDLHVAIQDSMGWLDYHLHHFTIKAKAKHKAVNIGIPDFCTPGDLPEVFPGWEIHVASYFNDLGITADYLYDYGDDWYHTIKLEGYIFKEKGKKYPCCTGGERSCPREDCGGIIGYSRLLELLSDPEGEEYEEYRVWVGEDWDPERFKKEEIKFENPHKRWKIAFPTD